MADQERLPPVCNSTDQWLALVLQELKAIRGATAPQVVPVDLNRMKVKEPERSKR